MGIVDVLLLSVALAMDCFTVSMVSGVILAKYRWGTILRMSFLFGLFQAAMPFAGWLGTSYFRTYIESFDHWVAFALLAFLGIKMIKESFDEDEARHFNPCKLKTQIVLAIATSIDALAVGISFACADYTSLSQLTFPLISIGLVSMFFGILGNTLGIAFGKSVGKRLRPELFGGIILLLIGIKILITHLLAE